MKRKALSIVELLVVVAIVAILAAILFPVFSAEVQAGKVSNKPNLRKIALAAQRYGADYDDRMPITINGRYRDLQNVADNALTFYGEKRTDAWPLILMPYVVDRTTYRDPRRDDVNNIWGGPPLATTDVGYSPLANTYRNQDRFPFYGYNYLFLSALYVPSDAFNEANPTDFMVAESHGFFEADRPAKTLFYDVSSRGWVEQNGTDQLGVQDTTRGHFIVDPPGFWGLAASSTNPYILFWNGTNCSGDWCGDTNPGQAELRTQNYTYIEPTLGGNNVAFLDAHVSFLSDVEMAAGTNYLTATPNGVYSGGGAAVTDKSKYIWNLNSNYFGLY